MFVILEGVDGGGKSTVAEALKTELENRSYTVESLHRGVPERPVLEEYQLDVETYRPGGMRAIVADRWHWGDLVYGELYRGFSYLGVPGFRYVELFLRSRGAVSVLVENTPEVIRERLASRGEDYLKDEHVEHVLREYQAIYESSATGVIRTSEPDVEDILRQAEYWEGQTRDLGFFPTYIGSRSPRVLLVGEKRSDQTSLSLTAFRPGKDNTGSGAYLLSALPERMWRTVGICNALEEPDLTGLYDTLALPPVIALGREASKHLDLLGIEHGAVPHPQYIKRFHHDQQSNYGELIADTITTQEKHYSWPN